MHNIYEQRGKNDFFGKQTQNKFRLHYKDNKLTQSGENKGGKAVFLSCVGGGGGGGRNMYSGSVLTLMNKNMML